MKRTVSFLLLICSSLFLFSCTLFPVSNVYSDHEKCDKLMEKLSLSLTNNDFTCAKTFFSPILYDMDGFASDLQSLIDYFDGDVDTIKGRVDSGEYSNYDYEEKHHCLEYTIITNVDTFRFSLNYIEKDSRDKNNVGIKSLYVLKLSEDEFPDDRYTGDIESIDGIHVAFPHVI